MRNKAAGTFDDSVPPPLRPAIAAIKDFGARTFLENRFALLTLEEAEKLAREPLLYMGAGMAIGNPLYSAEMAEEIARRAAIADATPSDEDLAIASSPPPDAWYDEDWSK